MDITSPRISTQSADVVPLIEMTIMAENRTKPLELDFPYQSMEDDEGNILNMFLAMLHICPPCIALGCLLAHP
ncbi:hypothetical protein BDW59DRAFT_155555 [Aspergillus cavernicola]|uniref:Uncharacterized protein n=1 Tax=Aspergillus cavernicola TaxID=176166 RepID=A0ABR4H7I4_9EURO